MESGWLGTEQGQCGQADYLVAGMASGQQGAFTGVGGQNTMTGERVVGDRVGRN